MKRIVVKFLAFLLTVCAFLTAVVSGAVMIILESNGLYTGTLDDQQQSLYEDLGYRIAWTYANRYASEKLGKCSEALLDAIYGEMSNIFGVDADSWSVVMYDGNQVVSRSGSYIPDSVAVQTEYTITVDVAVPSAAPLSVADDVAEATRLPEMSEPTAYQEELTFPDDPLYSGYYTVWDEGALVAYYISYYQGPSYTVQVRMVPEVIRNLPQSMLSNMYPYRYGMIALLVGGLLVFAAGLVYLLHSAGRTADGQVRCVGLNRLPLDLYAAAVGVGVALLAGGIYAAVSYASEGRGFDPALLTLMGLALAAATLLVLGWLYALAAQCRMERGYWLRHTVVGFLLWKLGRLIRRFCRWLAQLWGMIPLVGRWVAAAGGALLVLLFERVANRGLDFIPLVLGFLPLGALLAYTAWAYGRLLQGVSRMAQGNLDTKISTAGLVGSYKKCAEQLNSLADVARTAAEKQLRSERMRTELITNVSHDIKTPLTSIINYVDLLQIPHGPEQEQQYLEILARQSASMKRLIEDLIDLSKASTGNMAVNLEPIDAVETVNQALGEFADKLEAANLTPVFRESEEPVLILADGRLTWRVMSNLLSNAVKYAMPGTRLFITITKAGDQVCLSMKNVSREELRSSAEELMERFVQGDESRNTEGSGLGLNIAQSLMEVQHGRMQILLDGDLFKVTLIFPNGENS